jgi:hypothetical protein
VKACWIHGVLVHITGVVVVSLRWLYEMRVGISDMVKGESRPPKHVHTCTRACTPAPRSTAQ